MDLIVAPIAELRSRLTHRFEETVASVVDRGTGASIQPHTFTCGLTGGATALIFLGALREAAVDWSRLTLYWGDERAVPPDHVDSNFGLAERLLLSPLGARAPYAVRMPADDTYLTPAARRYAEQLPAGPRPADSRRWRGRACLFAISWTSGTSGHRRARDDCRGRPETTPPTDDSHHAIRVGSQAVVGGGRRPAQGPRY